MQTAAEATVNQATEQDTPPPATAEQTPVGTEQQEAGAEKLDEQQTQAVSNALNALDLWTNSKPHANRYHEFAIQMMNKVSAKGIILPEAQSDVAANMTPEQIKIALAPLLQGENAQEYNQLIDQFTESTGKMANDTSKSSLDLGSGDFDTGKTNIGSSTVSSESTGGRSSSGSVDTTAGGVGPVQVIGDLLN